MHGSLQQCTIYVYTHRSLHILNNDLLQNAGSYGNPTDYTREGNVAKALRKLNETCGSGDLKMVDVLRRAGVRSIHSFHDYNRKHREFYGCGI